MDGMAAGWTEACRTGAQRFKRHVHDYGNLINVRKMYTCIWHIFVSVMFLRIRMIVE
jgi:hypothetical protein